MAVTKQLSQYARGRLIRRVSRSMPWIGAVVAIATIGAGLAGLFGGLAGIMLFSDIGGFGQPTAAIGYELYVIAAVVIGGGSLLGGEGSILGSLIGALIITILYMGGQQMDWPKWVQEIVIGAIIIAAVALDRLRHRSLS